MLLLVVGGMTCIGLTNEVEVLSLDPTNPVADRFKKIKQFPKEIVFGGGGLSTHGT
jgi:hypothetical protein